MKEAIGSSLLLNIALVFIGIISAILISSIAYSKAFKAKNVIIDTIKNYNGDCDFKNGDSCFTEIEAELFALIKTLNFHIFYLFFKCFIDI